MTETECKNETPAGMLCFQFAKCIHECIYKERNIGQIHEPCRERILTVQTLYKKG